MSNKKSLFFKFDILSDYPKLKIFGNYNYKTTWSTIISILVIIFSFGFALYSSLKYFDFEEPNIYYWKNSVHDKNLTIKLNETLLMFKIGDAFKDNIIINKTVSFSASLYYFDFNSPFEFIPHDISLEKCELGKNINMKFQNSIKEYENDHMGISINDFYCISKEDSENYSLYYNKNYGYNFFSLMLYNNDSNKNNYLSPQNLRIYLILEYDFVDHKNKKNLINIKYIESYSSNFDDEILETTNFYLDYIEYDSDDGIIFEKINNYKGVRLNRETPEFYFKNDTNNKAIGRIKIQINRNTFDKYKRTYMKLQELLSEIESIINLFFIVGGILANVIAKKKMSLDLTRMIMKKKTEINKGDFNSYKNNISFNEIFGDIEDVENQENKINRLYSFDNFKPRCSYSFRLKDDKKNINLFNKNINNIKGDSKSKDKTIIKNVILKNMENNILNELKMKKINILNIILSYFCFKDRKSELINLCHNFIYNELSIDKILFRIFKLEKIYYLLSERDKAKIHYMNIKELEGINDYLKQRFETTTEEREIIKTDDIITKNDKKL